MSQIITGWRNRKPAPDTSFSASKQFTGALSAPARRALAAMPDKPPGPSIAGPTKVKSRKASI